MRWDEKKKDEENISEFDFCGDLNLMFSRLDLDERSVGRFFWMI